MVKLYIVRFVSGEECQYPRENNAERMYNVSPACGEGQFRDPLEILGSSHLYDIRISFFLRHRASPILSKRYILLYTKI